MLGVLVILAVSWALLKYVQKAPITVLGFTPVATRFHELFVGFLVFSTIIVSFAIDETWITGATWTLNPDVSVGLVFETLCYHVISALTEDLVFRGALLYILIERIGVKKALLISGTAFGIYHWFSFGMFGNSGIVPMLFVFFMSGFMGYAWGYAFHKTKSIAMGLGMHIGWNFGQSMLYKSSAFGEILYSINYETPMNDWVSLLFYLAKAIVPPLICIWVVNMYTKKQSVQTD